MPGPRADEREVVGEGMESEAGDWLIYAQRGVALEVIMHVPGGSKVTYLSYQFHVFWKTCHLPKDKIGHKAKVFECDQAE